MHSTKVASVCNLPVKMEEVYLVERFTKKPLGMALLFSKRMYCKEFILIFIIVNHELAKRYFVTQNKEFTGEMIRGQHDILLAFSFTTQSSVN